jgi:GNAT superfamily N-acetyltransferase
MNSKPLHDDYTLLGGGAELLDRVRPLWSELRRHHAELAPRWSESLLAMSFEVRRAELLAKSAAGILVLLVTCGEHDIAYCVNTISADASAEVDSLYVTPSHRGRGVGHALMTRTIDWFASQAIRSVVVDVISGNDVALQFYARYGFAARTVRMLRQAGGDVP